MAHPGWVKSRTSAALIVIADDAAFLERQTIIIPRLRFTDQDLANK